MKKVFIIFILSIISFTGKVWGQTTISTQDFEPTPGTPTWAYTSSGGTITTPGDANKYLGTKALRIAGTTAATVTFDNIDITNYSNVSLSVNFACTGVDTDEDLVLEISYDGGNTWAPTSLIKGYSNANLTISHSSSSTTPITVGSPYVISIPTDKTQIQIRFKTSSGMGSSEYYYLDNIKLTGTVNTSPRIYLSTISDFGNMAVGATSAEKPYTIRGVNLSNDILINAPTGFQISQTSGSGYTNSLVLPQIGGNIATQNLYVRFVPTEAKAYSDVITHTSTGATMQSLTLTGNSVPMITVSGSTLAFSNIALNNQSTEKTYTVSAVNLTSDLTVTAPAGFLISKTTGIGYASSLSIIPDASGVVSATTIYAVFKPSEQKAYNDVITHSSAGSTVKTLAVTGNSVPSVTISTSTLDLGNTAQNLTSSQKSYTVSAINLTSDLTITAPTGFSVSKTSGSSYVSSLSITPTATGNISTTTIYIVFKPTEQKAYNDDITHFSTGITTQNLAVTGNSVPSVTLGTLADFGEQGVSTVSNSKSYLLAGTNLTDNIIITAPSNFSISTTSTSGFTSSLTIVPSSGSVSKTIFVAFQPTELKDYSASVLHKTAGVIDQTLNVTGKGVMPTVNVVPIRDQYSGFGDWTDNSVAASSDYIKMINATSSLITPVMNFTNFTEMKLTFNARTFGGTTSSKNTITVSITIDNGLTWSVVGTSTPTSTTMKSYSFDLGSYISPNVKVKLETSAADGSIGAAVDDIAITGKQIGNLVIFSNGSTFAQPTFLSTGNNQPIGMFSVNTNSANSKLNTISVSMNPTSVSGITNVSLWASTDNTFDSSTDKMIDLQNYETTVNFRGISNSDKAIAQGNTYYFVAVDLNNANGKLSPTLVDFTTSYGTLSSFTAGALLAKSTTNPLPVELTTFTAASTSNGVKLTWSTATEKNNNKFEIERQAKSSKPSAISQWTKVGEVLGNGNSNSTKNYSFTDTKATGGTYVYRLKQIDNDGKYEYSKEVSVDLGMPTSFGMSQNYPNPFNPSTALSYQLSASSNVELRVYDILGKEVATLVNEKQNAGVYNVKFDASKLSSGMYIAKLNAGSFTKCIKMNLVK